MKLIYELNDDNNRAEHNIIHKASQDAGNALPVSATREKPLRLPRVTESTLKRHYARLEAEAYGVHSGVYPLGSCTMKHNPYLNEYLASLKGFSGVHPLQPDESAQGCLEVLYLAQQYLCEITGMDDMSLQPAAGAHGEYTAMMMIKAYFADQPQRREIIVPDSAHGTNPASAKMAGFDVVSLPSGADGYVDTDALRKLVSEKTAGLMLTNPNTLGLFEKDILAITDIVHEAGGLVYYDGANLNAIMGKVRPGDMGFDVVHLNLHKTFSTPHGGGGPGSGPVGCKQILAKYLPTPRILCEDGIYHIGNDASDSIGRVNAFFGHFSVVVKALAYILVNGSDGLTKVSERAVLNANYLMKRLNERFELAIDEPCMHEFVLTMANDPDHRTAMDVAKAMIGKRIHPPTVYFPLIIKEALMIEPTETESKADLDSLVETLCTLFDENFTPVSRVDEVKAARQPHLRYRFE